MGERREGSECRERDRVREGGRKGRKEGERKREK